MLHQLLAIFPVNTHPLILVSDPDGLLADESTLTVLSERGFCIIQETDPVVLRHRVEQAKPFSPSQPVLIITEGTLEALPYDLWQQGQRISLALHSFFPNLAYPILRTLSPIQRAQLHQASQPRERLGELGTIEFLLEHVFELRLTALRQPAYFILWLDEHHQRLAPLPPALAQFVLEQLGNIPIYKEWPLSQFLLDRQAYQDFMQGQWREFLSRHTGLSIGESHVDYMLNFEAEQQLQDALPRLMHNGSLFPVQVNTQHSLPVWVVPGIFSVEEDPRPRRMAELIGLLNEALDGLTLETRWENWKRIAEEWAELSLLTNDSNGILVGSSPDEKKPYLELRSRLDAVFTRWLQQHYSPLATRKLPIPHHVHHIPHYLNYSRTQGEIQKTALLVMDGMSLSDWMLIKQTWQTRHTDWQIKENLVLAQIPTITAISRHALISGLRPGDFYNTYSPKLTEAKSWQAFWSQRELSENEIAFLPLNLEKQDLTPEITNPRLQVICLIERQLDEIMHGTMLGAANHQDTVSLWLSGNTSSKNSAKLETLIATLFNQGYTVFITSDHGHCEAYGIGTPSEGIAAQSRGRRARLYSDRLAAQRIQDTYSDTILWEKDGLLPQDLFAVLPAGRQAFAEFNEIVITHGGITIDEIVVPFVELTKK